MTTEGEDEKFMLASSGSNSSNMTGGFSTGGDFNIPNDVNAIHNNYMDQLEEQYNDTKVMKRAKKL